jgi:hypothetical protein
MFSPGKKGDDEHDILYIVIQLMMYMYVCTILCWYRFLMISPTIVYCRGNEYEKNNWL